jgi:hypothetical protein
MNMQVNMELVRGTHAGLLHADHPNQVFYDPSNPLHVGIFADVRDLLARYLIKPAVPAINRVGILVPGHVHFHMEDDEVPLIVECDGRSFKSIVVPLSKLPKGARVYAFRLLLNGQVMPSIYCHPDIKERGPENAPKFDPFEHPNLCRGLYEALLAAPELGREYPALHWLSFYVMEKLLDANGRVPAEVIYPDDRTVIVTVDELTGEVPDQATGYSGVPIAYQLFPGNSRTEVMAKYTYTYETDWFGRHTSKKHA